MLAGNPETLNVGMIMIVLGLISLLFASFMLYRRRDIKRLFAYSSIEHMGIITFAFGMGGPLANFAGLLHMTMHSLTKSAIFFAVGHIAQVKGTQRIADIRGLSSTHPTLAVGLALGVIAIAGLPPFGVFMSEFMLVSSSFARQPLLAVVLVFGLLVAFGALILHLQHVLFGEPSGPPARSRRPMYRCSCISRLCFSPGCGCPNRSSAGFVPWPRSSGDGRCRPIASLLANRAPVAGHRPWPRYEVDAGHLDRDRAGAGRGRRRSARTLGRRRGCCIWRCAPADLSTPASCRLRVGMRASLDRPHHAPALRLERTIRDLHGYQPVGTPDRRPWLDHGAWGVRVPLGEAARRRAGAIPPTTSSCRSQGEGLHQIPVGPVHAGIIEPGHFRFTANGETVVRLEERLGYVHKGIDRLLTDVDMERAQRVIARVSGDSTVAYSFAFRARSRGGARHRGAARAREVLRGIMAELERIANHFGDIGAICNDASFTLIHAHCGIFRERVLVAAERAFAHRLMMDRVVPGGVSHDIRPAGAPRILAMLDEIEPPFAEIVRLYDDTPSLQDRTCTTGIVGATWSTAGRPAACRPRVGPRFRCAARSSPIRLMTDATLRGAGVAGGRRRCPGVDTHPRGRAEHPAAARLARDASGRAGAALRCRPWRSAREGIAMAEAFRGDVLVWLRSSSGRIARGHARDASWFQWPLLEAAIEGNIVADFPLCNKSFNCSYSGHDL